METITFKTHVGEDGILQIALPPEIKNADLEVTLVFQTVSISQTKFESIKQGWHKDFFEEVVGSWEGEPLIRAVQLQFEERDELL
ncbi:hypothetical protein IQ219_06090 [Synechocystis sp. LEGE 06083]|uniref:hypothetical protein n=1 Tax=Synechocystis sp. LEGE 06083 TaxID=915336 RepID=UPI00187E0956|nr:hypothetical protein [Synechocystis sp. LEGE 06083]MBE9194886.1 hypothetical protein [Synechocystis sp. LEGE 06083]